MEAVLPLSLTTAFLFCLLLLVTCRLLGGLLSPLDLNFTYWYQSHRFSSVQFSHSVVSDFLPPREPQHTRLPCPSPTPGVHPNLCPLSWWCHPAISSSVVPFSSCPQFFPESGSLSMSQLFTSSGQSTGASASTSVLPMNIQGWFPLVELVWSPCYPGDCQKSSPTPQFKSINSAALTSHICTWSLEKP